MHTALLVLNTAVAMGLGGIAAYASWNFTKGLYDLFPARPQRQYRGLLSTLILGSIDAVTDGISSAFDSMFTGLLAVIFGLAIVVSSIVATVMLPAWSTIPIALTVGLLPLIGVSLAHAIIRLVEGIVPTLSYLADLIGGWIGTAIDYVVLAITDFQAFLANLGQASERAGNRMRNAIERRQARNEFLRHTVRR